MPDSTPAGGSVASDELVVRASKIAIAYMGHNALSIGDLTVMLGDVHRALRVLTNPAEVAVPKRPDPAVLIRKSVTPDFIVCLEDGKKFKSMRRHLSLLGMTPEQYRLKWGLPENYPMVAPNYSEKRAGLAIAAGLGRKSVPVARARRSAKRAS